MRDPVLTDSEFQQFRKLIFDVAGISLSDAKKPLVSGRLARRVRYHRVVSFTAYFQLLMQQAQERQLAIDLLTTNETYFFREPKHFEFLRTALTNQTAQRNSALRVWSAACSSGEEVYSLAMLLADVLAQRAWEVVGSDISSSVLVTAVQGQYNLARANGIPQHYLHRYCLKGIGEQDGNFLIDSMLKKRTRFLQVNLNAPLPELGRFNVIFLRNVMIYFNTDTKRQVVQRILPLLCEGGYLIISHSETLNGITDQLNVVSPSIYQKPYTANLCR